MFERPELRRQHTRRRLEQRRQIDVVGTEAHAVFAQRRAGGLVEPLDLVRDLLAIEHAERFGELERYARSEEHTSELQSLRHLVCRLPPTSTRFPYTTLFRSERPELRRQHTRRRLEQRRQIDVVGTEAHAVFAQRRAGGLVEPLDLVRDLLAIEHAERFGELERYA